MLIRISQSDSKVFTTRNYYGNYYSNRASVICGKCLVISFIESYLSVLVSGLAQTIPASADIDSEPQAEELLESARQQDGLEDRARGCKPGSCKCTPAQCCNCCTGCR